jgi:hypothetical protein
MTLTLAGVCACVSGAREAVMTIWPESIGVLSMGRAGI